MLANIAAMFGYVLVAVALVASCVHAQEGEVIVPDNNKTECISQMVRWCDSMKYPQQGAGMSMLSLTYDDSSGYYRIFCSSDSDGTNCTKNVQPWFTCSSQNNLTYNGKLLTANGPNKDVDDAICKTADLAFNELFVQNLSYENTTLKTELQKGMESFFEQMAKMQDQIELLQKKLASIPMFGIEFLPELFNGPMFEITNATWVPPDQNNNVTTEQNTNATTEQKTNATTDQNTNATTEQKTNATTEQNNQIERE